MSSLPDAVQVGDWRVEPELDVIARDGRAIKVEPRAMRVLGCLIARAGHVVSVEELLEQAWPDVVVGPDSVYQAVGLLRRTLGDDRHHPVYIEHVPRKGYRLVAPIGTPAEPDESAPDGSAGAAPNLVPANGATVPPLTVPGAIDSAPPRPAIRFAWAVLAAAIATLGAAYFLVRSAIHAPSSGAVTVATRIIGSQPSAAVPPPSIAVLPFLDLSEKQDLGYFADGLAEELIDQLARGSELRVPARTSSFYFKGKTATVSDMARALHVDHLLEGSVRRSGNRVRVTAQLIRADSGYHLWSQTYDRELNELFAVEDDITRAVSSSLQVKLRPGPSSSSAVAASDEAHNLQLQCAFFVGRNSGPDIEKAVACYKQLLALAPQDAPAWAGYANALWRLQALKEFSEADERRTRAAARAAAQHALAIDPHLAAAHATLAVTYLIGERNWSAADAEVRAALASDPDDPMTLMTAAALARDRGQLDRAIDFCERARARDPLNFVPYARLGTIYLYLGRLPEAEAAARRRIDLSPEGEGGHLQLVDVLLARGQPQAALDTARTEPNEPSRLAALALVYTALGRTAEADSALKELQHKYPGAWLVLADIYAERGETDRAFAVLEEAAAGTSPDPELLQIQIDPYFRSLHGDPRYRGLLRKLGFPPSGPS